jgi:hypothetical protein
VINGTWDLVPGGFLSKLFNPGAIIVDTGLPSFDFKNHLIGTYKEKWPPGP